MQFEYYVLNYNPNKKCVERFNIFRNINVQECTEKEIKKYLRSPKNYKHIIQYENNYLNKEEIAVYGFEALCEKIRHIIMWQEWSRREYEISVSDSFVFEIRYIGLDNYDNLENLKSYLKKISENNPKLEKWDCYKQCEPNIEMITRECIYQYKKQLKEEKNNV